MEPVMRIEIKRTASVFLLLFLYCLTVPMISPAQQEASESEKVHPGPRDIKEKTTILVFIIWLWISIVVLGIFLRLKIIEVDRLFQQKYFDSPKGRKFINPENKQND